VSARERHVTWEWWFDAPPSRVWPLVADTDRTNRDAGMPSATYERAMGTDRDGVLRARQQVYGLLGVEYEEDPFEWVEPERFSVERRFSRGPLARLRVRTRLEPDGRGTRVVTDLDVVPRTWWASMFFPLAIRSARRAQDRAYALVEAALLGNAPDRPARRRVLRLVRDRLATQGDAVPEDLATLLATHLASADAGDLRRMRPFALADRWKVPRRETLAAFLRAVRAGVLDLSWDSLCPHCRGSARGAPTLSAVRSANRCEACGVDFEVVLDRNLEAVFRPAADVRPVGPEAYCLGGPRNTPHVVAQARVPPGKDVEVEVALEPGAYAVRAPRRARVERVRVDEGDDLPARATVDLEDEGVRASATTLAKGRARLRVRNPGARDATVVVERTGWLDDVATALDVLSVPGFRDLFAAEVLAPGERIAVRHVAILFTDLKGSTALYQHIGDAAAYALVRDHFRVLREAVRRRGGMVVKTIGDAVMASFRSASDALSAALDMQRSIRALPPPDGRAPLVLKAGLHQGPSLVVNSAGQIDFFGTTTNLAARAGHASEGGDVVVTDSVIADDDARRLLEALPHRAEAFPASLKGFDGEVTLHRLTLE
jgi:class 3 adenylate cyclase